MLVDGRTVHTCVERGIMFCQGHHVYSAGIGTSSVGRSTTALASL